MPATTRCPKCGLFQLAAAQCKACGTPFAARPAPVRSAAAAGAGVMAPPIRPGAPIPAPAPPSPAAATAPPAAAAAPRRADPRPALDPAFDRTRFLLNQKMLTIHARYDVCDEQGQPIVFVERPAHFWRNGLAILLGVIAGLLAAAAVFFLTELVWPKNQPTAVVTLAMALMGCSLIVLPFLVFSKLGRKRDILFYRDATKSEPLLVVRQDQTATLLEHTYTVAEPSGRVLAYFRKNIFSTLYRTRWLCDGADRRLMAVAVEDSLLSALIRRYVIRVTPMNFVFWLGDSERVVGRFNRKFTLRDRYVLDLTEDPTALLDRRVALALGVILDTGEHR